MLLNKLKDVKGRGASGIDDTALEIECRIKEFRIW